MGPCLNPQQLRPTPEEGVASTSGDNNAYKFPVWERLPWAPTVGDSFKKRMQFINTKLRFLLDSVRQTKQDPGQGWWHSPVVPVVQEAKAEGLQARGLPGCRVRSSPAWNICGALSQFKRFMNCCREHLYQEVKCHTSPLLLQGAFRTLLLHSVCV